jgi:Zn finger protein HypA/HybF involved in hydrogenase expression
MHEHGLAKELWPQLRRLAKEKGLSRVTRVEMVIGTLHGVSGDFLAHSFEHAFEGSGFAGAEVRITIVDPGQDIRLPGAARSRTASGWELMVTGMEGQ